MLIETIVLGSCVSIAIWTMWVLVSFIKGDHLFVHPLVEWTVDAMNNNLFVWSSDINSLRYDEVVVTKKRCYDNDYYTISAVGYTLNDLNRREYWLMKKAYNNLMARIEVESKKQRDKGLNAFIQSKTIKLAAAKTKTANHPTFVDSKWR